MTGALDIDPFGELERDAGEPLGRRIVTRNVADQIVDRMVTAVALGVYVPGQRLPSERDLSQMLQVSRTGVREALHRLAEAGYIEGRRGRQGGSFVLSGWGPNSAEMVGRHLLPNGDRFEALFDARCLIEPLIARTAAERRTRSDVKAIRKALELYRQAGDREASRQADEQIRSRVSLHLGAEPYTTQARKKAALQHEALTDAIDVGDGGLAAQIASSHVSLSDGPVVALVNGLADDLDSWGFQVPALLAAGLRVVRFDNRGIRKSGAPTGPYRAASSACRTPSASSTAATPTCSISATAPASPTCPTSRSARPSRTCPR
ncbi:GntR family transcriptional regulator [Dermatophilaceae bacterium Soc4.6]